MFSRKFGNRVIVDFHVLLAHAVLNGIKPLARLVGLCAMGQVAACIKAHAQDGIAGRQKSCENPLVRLAA